MATMSSLNLPTVFRWNTLVRRSVWAGHLVDHLLDAEELIRPVGKRFKRTNSGYYLLKNQAKKPFPEQKIVEEWLLSISAARTRYATWSTGFASATSGGSRCVPS